MSRLIVCVLAIAALACAQLPENFDARDKWPSCTSQILDQGRCGSCWAFSATTSMATRFCIHAKGSNVTELSPQYMIDCNRIGQGGCQGGDTMAAYGYVQSNGIDALQCTPYTSGTSGTIQTCPSTCKSGEDIPKLYMAVDHYSLVKADTKTTVLAMQEELVTNGPFSISFVVYSDFMTFFKSTPKGIYKHKTGGALGGHAVKLVGYGTENGVDYWTVANSWGTMWGDQGFFKIVRGSNDCTIESRRVTAGMPKVSPSNTYKREETTVIDGARTKIAIDNEIVELARFALAEVADKHNVDTFHGVKEAYAQVVNGVVYDLVLSVANANGAARDIEVRVVRSATDKLTAF